MRDHPSRPCFRFFAKRLDLQAHVEDGFGVCETLEVQRSLHHAWQSNVKYIPISGLMNSSLVRVRSVKWQHRMRPPRRKRWIR